MSQAKLLRHSDEVTTQLAAQGAALRSLEPLIQIAECLGHACRAVRSGNEALLYWTLAAASESIAMLPTDLPMDPEARLNAEEVRAACRRRAREIACANAGNDSR